MCLERGQISATWCHYFHAIKQGLAEVGNARVVPALPGAGHGEKTRNGLAVCRTGPLAMIVGHGSAERPPRLERLSNPWSVPGLETAAAQRSIPMTGLDLESFLLLLRADLTTWMVLGLATIGSGGLGLVVLAFAACASQLSGAFAGGPSRPGLVRQHDPCRDVDHRHGSP